MTLPRVATAAHDICCSRAIDCLKTQPVALPDTPSGTLAPSAIAGALQARYPRRERPLHGSSASWFFCFMVLLREQGRNRLFHLAGEFGTVSLHLQSAALT
jgi:hypothetical protein